MEWNQCPKHPEVTMIDGECKKCLEGRNIRTKTIRGLILLIVTLLSFISGIKAQVKDTILSNQFADYVNWKKNHIDTLNQTQKDSIRFEKIDEQLRLYGRQNVTTDKITFASIIIIIGGTILKSTPGPMLVSNSLCSLAILAISWKADLHLSKHKSKNKTNE